MADTYQFWTHGVNVVPQETPHLTGHQNDIFMMPLSWGTVIRQASGTENWFHLPIPTPTHLDDWKSWNQHAFLRVKIGSQAEINKVQIWADTSDTGMREIFATTFAPNEQLDFDINDHIEALGPLVISVRVKFDDGGSDEDRMVIFKGAGASFVEANSP